MFLGYAIRDSLPLFYVPMLEEFGKSRAETALIFSISFMVYGFASAVAGAVLDRFGPRKTFTTGIVVIAIGLVGCSQAGEIWHIYIFWGVVYSLGMAAIGFVPCNTVVSRWFTRKRATAIGIAQAGGRESFVVAPVIQSLITALGWRDTYLVIAGVTLVLVVILVQFLRHSPQEMDLNPDGDPDVIGDNQERQAPADRLVVDKEWAATDWTLLKAMKKYRFWAMFTAQFTNALAFGIVMAHQVAFIVDIGFSALFASYLLLIFGIVGMVGRLSAFLADIIGREVTYTLSCSGVVIGFVMLILAEDTSSAWMLYVYAVFFGLFSGLNGPTMVTSMADIFQGKHFGAILGFANIGFGLGNSVGSWYGGYVFDVFGSYRPAFITATAAIIVAAASIWVASPRKIRAIRSHYR